VQNFLRRTRVPGGAVSDIVLRYQLIVETRDGRKVTAFGGPVSGRSWRRSGDDGGRMPAALRDTDRIRDRWERAAATPDADARTVRSWDLPAVLALLVLIAGAVAALAVVGAGT
jgi:hypothetical protein